MNKPADIKEIDDKGEDNGRSKQESQMVKNKNNVGMYVTSTVPFKYRGVATLEYIKCCNERLWAELCKFIWVTLWYGI